MPFRLISTGGEQSFELRQGPPLVIGRALNTDIPIVDPTISRRHAEVACEDDGVRVRDLGSANGTFVDGEKILEGFARAGSLVTFGKVAFRVQPVTVEAPIVSADSSLMPGEQLPTPPPPLPPVMRGGGATIVRPMSRPSTDQALAALRPSGASRKYDDGGSGEASEARNQLQLRALLRVSMDLAKAVSVDALLVKIADYAFSILDIDRVSILLLDEKEELIPRISRDKQGSDAGRTVPQSIAREAIEMRHAILSDNAFEDTRFGGQSIVLQRVRSALCAPLIGEDKVLGVIYVDNLTTTHRFDDRDLEFLIAFSGLAAVAIENSQFAERIRHESVVRSNFERYFAPNLAARIASSVEATKLGGEKRPVAVLFSDIRGFTALSETMNPDDMAQHLTEYFTEMVECVFRTGGTLDKFIGDSVMAQWGAPLATDDDPDRAVKSAIEMMTGLDRLNEGWRAQGRPELQIGIGLNFGEAFAGNIGSERRLEFTVIGDTVNTASRLCSAALAGEILISEDMRRALKDPPELRGKPAITLKGKAHPVPIYSVVR